MELRPVAALRNPAQRIIRNQRADFAFRGLRPEFAFLVATPGPSPSEPGTAGMDIRRPQRLGLDMAFKGAAEDDACILLRVAFEG